MKESDITPRRYVATKAILTAEQCQRIVEGLDADEIWRAWLYDANRPYTVCEIEQACDEILGRILDKEFSIQTECERCCLAEALRGDPDAAFIFGLATLSDFSRIV